MQMTTWLNYLESHPLDLDSTSYGFIWMKAAIPGNTGTVISLVSTGAATRVIQGIAYTVFCGGMDGG